MAEDRAIQPISKEVAHRICTGQVIGSLGAACKELIDNALDAGAKLIEIRLKGYGSEMLEVADDGRGVRNEDLAALCKPHQTSKLRNIDDLTRLGTYGFRGEALNALCALSNVTITTRSAEDPIATRLTFDHHGEATAKEKCSRQPGMTVVVQNLFEPLPVRRKELLSSINSTSRKEYCKLLAIVQSYAVVAINVRFVCSSTIADKKHLVLRTEGNLNIMNNICNVFGSKQVTALLEICHTLPSEQLCADFGIKDVAVFDNFKLSGYISSSEHGQGRSTSDRQFVYINQRPVEYVKVSKIINEVYHQFNRGQVPLFVLCITMPPNLVDVNLSPDKRQVYVVNEKELFALVKSSLLSTFESVAAKCPSVPTTAKFTSASTLIGAPSVSESSSVTPITAPVAQSNKVSPSKMTATATAESQKRKSETKQIHGGAQTVKNLKRPNESATTSSSEPKKQSLLEAFAFGKKRIVESEQSTAPAIAIDVARAEAELHVETAVANRRPRSSESPSMPSGSGTLRDVVQRTTVSNLFGLPPGLDMDVKMDEARSSLSRESALMDSRPNSTASSVGDSVVISTAAIVFHQPSPGLATDITTNDSSSSMTTNSIRTKVEVLSQMVQHVPLDNESFEPQPSSSAMPTSASDAPVGVQVPQKIWRIEEDLPMSMEKLKARMAKLKQKPVNTVHESEKEFSAQLNSDQVKVAEAELTRYFRKSDFEKMQVIGQFNRGFILARLNDDLFIVDQHASDEKHNFETLQKKARIQTQKLIQPQSLELGPIQELIVQDNLDIFKANGFEFLVDNDADPGKRVKLTAVPAIHNWTFDKSDVDEMVGVLAEFSGIMCRPTRLRKLFASKACRKSVMIGTALNKSQMTRIVGHLGKLENPWTCPHGRPTLRHLRSL